MLVAATSMYKCIDISVSKLFTRLTYCSKVSKAIVVVDPTQITPLKVRVLENRELYHKVNLQN